MAVSEASEIVVAPIEAQVALKDRIYAVLKDAIVAMNIYASSNLRFASSLSGAES